MGTAEKLVEKLVDIIIDKCEPIDTVGSLNEDTGEGHMAELYQYEDTWLIVDYFDDKERSTFFGDEDGARKAFLIVTEKIKKEETDE